MLRRFRVAVCLLLIFLSPGYLFGQNQGAPANPETPALLKQGDAALAARHFSEAEKSFKKAAKLEHDQCAACYVGLAQVKNSMGDTGAALSDCDRALASAPNDQQRAQIHDLRGDILLQTGDPKKMAAAESEYRTSLQLDSSEPLYHLKLAIALFKQSRDSEGQQEISSYVNVAPAGSEYISYSRKLAANPRRARENFAPEFSLTTVKGEALSLNDLGGRIVVLDFWATWCPPCRESVPELKDMTRKYSPEKLVLISISADQDEKQWREFIAKKNMDWAQYWDRDGKMRKLMNVHAFPTYLVIDPDGVIRERIVGMNPQDSIVHRLKEKLQIMWPKG